MSYFYEGGVIDTWDGCPNLMNMDVKAIWDGYPIKYEGVGGIWDGCLIDCIKDACDGETLSRIFMRNIMATINVLWVLQLTCLLLDVVGRRNNEADDKASESTYWVAHLAIVIFYFILLSHPLLYEPYAHWD